MAKRRADLVVPIGVLKLVKAAALIVLGAAGVLNGADRLAHDAERTISLMAFFSVPTAVHRTLGKLEALDRSTARWLGLLCLCYAAVFLVEGLGLLRKKRWAEWLTVIVTASFIPVEVYELVGHFGVGKVVTLVLNLAIVVYLAWRRLEERRGVASRIRAALPFET